MSACIVTGKLKNGGGGATADAIVSARVQLPVDPIFDEDGSLISDDVIETTTDENGEFALVLIQGLRYVIHIDAANYHRLVRVPFESSADIQSLN